MKKTAFEHEFDSCPLILKKFFFYTRTIRGKEQNTINTYYYHLKLFFLYMLYIKGYTEKISANYQDLSLINIEIINGISSEDILGFLYYCSKEKKVENSTRANYLSSIKEYFNYLHIHEKIIESNPAGNIESPKIPKKLPKYLTEQQAISLLESVEGTFKDRDYCILTLLLNCGLRISELINLNYKDIRGDNTVLIKGKGNKERIIYLNDACINAIEKYKKVRPVDGVKNKEAFFVSSQGNRFARNSINYIVEKYMKKVGLGGQGYSPHKLRHTCATLMLSGGTDIRTIQDFLGHENLATTQIYTHISSEKLKKASTNNPLAKLKEK